MTNKNLPDAGADKYTTGTDPTDKRTHETPEGTATQQPARDGDRRGAAGNATDSGNKSNVPNPGRDITTGGTGGDGTNRKMPNDSTMGSADTNSDADQDAAEVDDETEEAEKA